MALTVMPTISQDPDHGNLVEFTWSSDTEKIDRPKNYGISCGHGKQGQTLANRVAAACKAGVLFGPATVKADVSGKTYVHADCRVIGRHLNADLKRLGF